MAEKYIYFLKSGKRKFFWLLKKFLLVQRDSDFSIEGDALWHHLSVSFEPLTEGVSLLSESLPERQSASWLHLDEQRKYGHS